MQTNSASTIHRRSSDKFITYVEATGSRYQLQILLSLQSFKNLLVRHPASNKTSHFRANKNEPPLDTYFPSAGVSDVSHHILHTRKNDKKKPIPIFPLSSRTPWNSIEIRFHQTTYLRKESCLLNVEFHEKLVFS